MTVKKNPNYDSPGDFVGRGGLGAGGGRTSTGSTGGKSIVTGKKSSVSKKSKNKLKGKKERRQKQKDLKTYLEKFKKSSPNYVDRRKPTKDAEKANKKKITKEDVASHVKATKEREKVARARVVAKIAREDREAAERKGLDFRKTSNRPSRSPSRSEIEMELTKMREQASKK